MVAVTMVMSCLAFVGIPSEAHADAAPEAVAPSRSAPPPLEVPAPEDTPTPTAVPAPADGEVAPTTDATSPASPPAVEPIEPIAPAISADLLDAAPPTTPTTPTPAADAPVVEAVDPVEAEDERTPNEAITEAYAPKFRPKANPGKLNVTARLLFANAGAKGSGGGRFAGASADVGQSWNGFGYALTASAYGGRFALSESGTAEVNALLGGGPTVGLGRRALLGRGYLDLRAGYDVFYGVVNQRDESTTVRPQSDDSVVLNPTKYLVPHGPRVRLDLGLVALDDSRRFWHGFGVSMGYQALVGSAHGEMPVTHILSLGLSYWMG